MLVDVGTDFPPEMLASLLTLNTSSVFRDSLDRLTTRGWNSYASASSVDSEYRAFRYLTPKRRVEVGDFFTGGVASWVGERMSAIHMICSPERAVRSVRELWRELGSGAVGEEKSRQGKWEEGGELKNKSWPLVFWEPVPDFCSKEYKEAMLNTLEFVDVVSPNEGELLAFFADEPLDKLDSGMGWEESEGVLTSSEDKKRRTEILAKKLALHRRMGGRRQHGAVIVRCGAQGCYLVWQHGPSSNDAPVSPGPPIIPISTIWLPAYHTPTSTATATATPESNSPTSVVDPTGAGNAFMGGLAVGMSRQIHDSRYGNINRWILAAMYGQVAASFVVEQVGVPRLSVDPVDGVEKWNGEVAQVRLRRYVERLERDGLGVWTSKCGKLGMCV